MLILALLFALAASATTGADVPVPAFFHQRTIQAGDTLTATNTAEKGPFASSKTIPTCFISGAAMRLDASGAGSTLPGGGSLTFRLKLGSTVLWTSQAYTADNSVWYAIAYVRCETAGASGSALVSVRHGVGPGTGSFVGSSGLDSTVQGVDWTQSAVFGLTCQWSVANGGHTAVQQTCDVLYFY